MLWIFSTLRALHGFVQRCTVRAFLPLLLVLLCVFRSTRPFSFGRYGAHARGSKR